MACPKCGNTAVSFFDPCPRCGNGEAGSNGAGPVHPTADVPEPAGAAQDADKSRVRISMLAWCIASAIYIIGSASGDGRRPARHTIDLMALALVWSWWMYWRPAKREWGWAAALALPLAVVPCFPLFPVVLWRLMLAQRPAAVTPPPSQ